MKRRRPSSTAIDMEVSYRGHLFRVTGTAEPYVPATGPSMAGPGDPAEGGGIEDLEAALIFTRKDNTIRRRDLGELSDKLRDELEEIVMERLADEDGS